MTILELNEIVLMDLFVCRTNSMLSTPDLLHFGGIDLKSCGKNRDAAVIMLR